MKAEDAGKMFASRIERSWPQDKAEIFADLRLAMSKAWKEGKWRGMTREGFVPIQYDCSGGFIIAPYETPILLAVNVDNIRRDIRSTYFQFHKNGDGSIINYPGCKWNRDVYDIGESPILEDGKININSGVLIGVRAIGNPGPNEKVWINGAYSDNKRIYSYQRKYEGLDSCGCSIQKDEIKTVEGIELEVKPAFHYICNVKFSQIFSITKTVTRCPIEVVAIDASNKAHPIAYLYPNQKQSSYRKYRVPSSCTGCVHGLFKIRDQEPIVNGSEDLIIHDEEAVLSLMMAIDYIYRKKDPNSGAVYFAQAITILDKEKGEVESPETFPIQIERVLEGDVPEIFKYVS